MTRRVAGRETGPIGLGCMGMSWAYDAEQRDDATSVAVIHRALELGATLLDTADVYGPYTNEELVGRALSGRRDEAVLATKCGMTVEDIAEYRLGRDGRPDHVREAIDASLRRLGTDHVDLYQLHRIDPPRSRGRVAVRAAIYGGPRSIQVGDRPDPVVTAPTDAVVRVVLACVCGSDLWYYRGESPDALGSIGHEFVGVVDQVGTV